MCTECNCKLVVDRDIVSLQKAQKTIFYCILPLSLFVMKEDKLKQLLSIVIENYIHKGDPIGSKFLHSLENTDYAPSTLRKYLNLLEKDGLLYQPYNSSGRIPTVKGLSSYMEWLLLLTSAEDTEQTGTEQLPVDLDYARDDLQSMVETLGEFVDGAVVGFLREDAYYYLGLNNLLRESLIADHETTRYLVKFIESKELVQQLDARVLKQATIYYTFLENDEKPIAIIYTKIAVNGYDAIISVLGPSRVDHRKNVHILKQFLAECSQ